MLANPRLDPFTSHLHPCPTRVPASYFSRYLYKQGEKGLKGYKRRWFVLNDQGRLNYYASRLDIKSKGFIDLGQATVVRAVPTPAGSTERGGGRAPSGPQFQVVLPTRVYQLVAANDQELAYWLNGLALVRESLAASRGGMQASISGTRPPSAEQAHNATYHSPTAAPTTLASPVNSTPAAIPTADSSFTATSPTSGGAVLLGRSSASASAPIRHASPTTWVPAPTAGGFSSSPAPTSSLAVGTSPSAADFEAERRALCAERDRWRSRAIELEASASLVSQLREQLLDREDTLSRVQEQSEQGLELLMQLKEQLSNAVAEIRAKNDRINQCRRGLALSHAVCMAQREAMVAAGVTPPTPSQELTSLLTELLPPDQWRDPALARAAVLQPGDTAGSASTRGGATATGSVAELEGQLREARQRLEDRDVELRQLKETLQLLKQFD